MSEFSRHDWIRAVGVAGAGEMVPLPEPGADHRPHCRAR